MKNLLRAIIASIVLFIIFFVISYNVIEMPQAPVFTFGSNIIITASKTVAAMSISFATILVIILITGIFVYIDCLKKKKDKKCTKKFVIFLIATLLLLAISLFFFFLNVMK